MNDSENVMIDIETLGISAHAVILSIGAYNLETEDTMYVELDCEKQPGRTIDIGTIKFWLKQSTPCPITGLYTLATALEFLRDFTKGKTVWANGTDFDISILSHAYTQCNMAPGWKYNAVRDYRTLAKLLPHIKRGLDVGNRHDALADAINQAVHLKLLLEEVEKWTPIPSI